MKDPETPSPAHKSWLRRYVSIPAVIVICVIVYLTFFGDNSIVQRLEYEQSIDSISALLAAEEDSLQYYRDLNNRLSTDPELMEQVVREQYNMNRPNEDVFLITDE